MKLYWGYSSRDKTWSLIKARYYFLGGKTWVANEIKNSFVHMQKDARGWDAVVMPLKVIPITPKIMWRVHFDLLGPLPRSSAGNKYVALGVCSFTKFVEGERNISYYNVN